MNSGGLLTLRDARAYGAAVSFLQDFARLMDRLIAAQTRLEQALDRLSAALEKKLGNNAAASAMAGEIERVRSENVLLRADKSEVADKLDAAIGRLKILIES